jgi:hypothetical protein
MELKRSEGTSEILSIALIIICYTLLGIILVYLTVPSLFEPMINTMKEWFSTIINIFKKE